MKTWIESIVLSCFGPKPNNKLQIFGLILTAPFLLSVLGLASLNISDRFVFIGFYVPSIMAVTGAFFLVMASMKWLANGQTSLSQRFFAWVFTVLGASIILFYLAVFIMLMIPPVTPD